MEKAPHKEPFASPPLPEDKTPVQSTAYHGLQPWDDVF